MRWAGEIGFINYVDDGTGLIISVPDERHYTGELFNEYQQNNTSNSINANTQISASIDVHLVPADFDRLHEIRYVVNRGVAWQVTRTTGDYPKITLYLGGRYSGE